MSPTLWVILAAAVCLGTGVGIVRYIGSHKASTEPVTVTTPCDLNGHGLRYQARDTSWFCATCGARLHDDSEPQEPKSVRAASTASRSLTTMGSMLTRWRRVGQGTR